MSRNVITEKIPEFKSIPDDWKVKLLSDVSWFQEGPGLRNWQFTQHGMKVINITNLEDGYLNLGYTERHISFEEFEKMYKHFAIDAEDIVMASSGATYCKTAVVREFDLPLVMNTSVIRFKPINGINYDFLLSYLGSALLKKQIDFLITGGAQPNFGPAHLKQTVIPLPPLPEQKAIAQVLITADAAIHNTEKLIAQKELRKKWLMQQLLTGKKRLKGFDGEWVSQKISTLFHPVDRYIDWDENALYNLISIRRRNGGIFLREPLYGHQIGVKKLKQVAVNDFVISKRQVSHGAWAVVDQTFDGAKISDEYDSLTITNPNLLKADFWKWYCQIPVLMHYAYVDSDGVHIEKSIFDYDLFKRRHVLIPSCTKEQTAIAQVLQAADKEISLLKAKADKLREQKKGLMQVLLTGKVRLKIK